MDKQLARIFTFILLALPCFAQTPNQTQQVQTYYVDAITPGNDANPGTAASPFATVAHVATIAATGNARVFVKFPNLSWQLLQMPYLNLAALWIGQQGTSSTTIYDVAGGDHGTLHGTVAWSTGNGLNGLTCDGSTTYATMNPVIGNSNFIVYMVGSVPAGKVNVATFSESRIVSDRPLISGSVSVSADTNYLLDATNGNSFTGSAVTSNTATASTHVWYIARNTNTAYAGLADLGLAGTPTAVTGVNTTGTTVSSLCAWDSNGLVNGFWAGTLNMVAIYKSYPTAAVAVAQYAGIRTMEYTVNNLLRTPLLDANLTPGPVWVRQGELLGNGTGGWAGKAQEPSVIYEGNCQIVVSSACFKLWFSGDSSTVNYAESITALPGTWSIYGSNPVVTGHAYSSILKVGSTYYLYSSNTSNNHIDQYTSSDGVTFSLSHADVLVPTAGTPDAGGIFNTWVVYDAANSIWRMMYDGDSHLIAGSPFYTDLTATSTDGITWTKNQGSAIGYNVHGPCGVWFTEIEGLFWVWGQDGVNPNPPTTQIYRGASYRWSGLIQLYPQTAVFPLGSVSDEALQTADPSLVEVAGSTYMFYGAVGAGGNPQTIKLAIAPMTIRQLVQTTEGETTTSP